MDDVHPFYADLMNVLYDKDHYKLALGQMNMSRHMIDNIAKDYVRLLKYADSAYRCKQLKRAALGRMCTLMKRQGSSLAYLEQVRQHLSRLPSIDPNTRTLLVTGFPNVGKSSFINKISRADVDVQPYAFTTKSLFVGHTDHNYLRWQVIDTPGILDHPLEQRNTIEMQAITAMAHLRAAILYVMDLSEQCGHTVTEQLSLFENIRPLFANKPLTIVCNKSDIIDLANASADTKVAFEKLEADGVEIMEMSTLTEAGVIDVKTRACDKLLEARIETKLRSGKINDVLHRLHVAMPVARDEKKREPFIPSAAASRRKVKQPIKLKNRGMISEEMKPYTGPKPRTLRDLEIELDGEYSTDLRAEWDLKDESWKYDEIPEIVDGRNVADFVDPDIMARLEELEAEEEARDAAGEYADDSDIDDAEVAAIRADAAEIREKKAVIRIVSRDKKSSNKPRMPPQKLAAIAARAEAKAANKDATKGSTEAIDAHLDELGVEATEPRRGRSLERKRKRGSDRDISRGRSGSVDPHNRSLTPSRAVAGLGSEENISKARKLKHRGQIGMQKLGRAGEADRAYKEKMPKHLFAGKMSSGTRSSR